METLWSGVHRGDRFTLKVVWRAESTLTTELGGVTSPTDREDTIMGTMAVLQYGMIYLLISNLLISANKHAEHRHPASIIPN